MQLPDKKISIINKLESLRKPDFKIPQIPSKKIESKDASIFHGQSQVSRIEIKSKLKSKEFLAKANEDHLLKSSSKYGILNPWQMPELEKMFPERFGGYIDHTEAARIIKDKYWEIEHMKKNLNLNNLENRNKITVEENKLKFLKDITGLK